MAVNFGVFASFMGHVGGARIDLDSDTFKAVLSNVAPDLFLDEDLADITQIDNGNGYTTGGVTLASVVWEETSTSPHDGIWRFSSANFEWEADSGAIGPFRYVVIYSDTSTDDKLVGRYDFGSELTIPDGSFFRVEVGVNGHVRFGVGTIA